MTPPATANADPFFIIGTGRCGSTLLQRMIMAHSLVQIPPETHFFARFDPKRLLGVDPVPSDRLNEYITHCTEHPWFAELGLDPAALRAAAAEDPSARGIFLWLIARMSGDHAKRPGEKTPQHEKYVDRILHVFPDARFIHICRDPRDVALSLRKEHWMRDDSYQRIAHHIAKVWRRQRAAEERLGPKTYRRIRYEDLVTDPEREIRSLCAFLDLPFEPAMLEYHTATDTGFLEKEAGWKGLTLKPIDASRIGRYRDRLTDREIRSIERRLGDLLEAYGYERDDDAADSPVWPLLDAAERLKWVARRAERSVEKRVSRDEAAPDGEAGA